MSIVAASPLALIGPNRPRLRGDRVAVFGSAEYLALNDDSIVVSGRAGLRVVF